MKDILKPALCLAAALLIASVAPAADITIKIDPTQVPDETPPRVNVGDYPTGFPVDSWQGPATGKTNWHARYLLDGDYLSALFPAEAATMTINDIAEIRYYTKRPAATPSGRDWWIQIYTRPDSGTNCSSWYKNRFINNYNDHTATGAWTQYSTGGAMTFNKNACGTTGEMTLAQLKASYGSELIEMISVQTDSGWNGFDGYLDGLEIVLTNNSVGHVNFEDVPPAPVPAAEWWVLVVLGLAVVGVAAVRRFRTA